MRKADVVVDLLEPYPGRLARALEISFACMMVVLVSMMYQIPDPATSTYLIFFAAKENAGLNIVMSIVLIVVVTLVVAISFGLALLSLNSPEGRILVIAAVAFVAFFLGTASKLAPLASTMGLIVAYALDLLGSSPFGEITTRGLLYAWLFVAMPMLVFIAYNIVLGRRPETLLRQAIATRLRAASDALREKNEKAEGKLIETFESGNSELLKMLKMVKLLRFQPLDTIERLRALVMLSYSLAITVFAVKTDNGGGKLDDRLPTRIDELANGVEHMPRLVQTAAETKEADDLDPRNLEDQIVVLVASIKEVVAGAPLPNTASHTRSKVEKSGFFASDAFQNLDHVRFAVKGTAAVMICYLTFTLLDWPGIHTSMLTCFIVGLTTIGETMQKLTLRIVGCCVGAVFGLLSIVYILPNTTSITSLLLVIGVVTLPTAWVAVGKPTVSYIGFQAAFALYLCILQGNEPKFDLTIVRDRTIGILFGNIVIYLIFTRVFPVSMLVQLRGDLVHLIERCREVLRSVSDARPAIVTATDVAEMQASLEKLEQSAAAFGYETLLAENARLQSIASRRAIESLRGLTLDLCRVAAYPPLLEQSSNGSKTIQHVSLELHGELETLEQLLLGRAVPVEKAAEHNEPPRPVIKPQADELNSFDQCASLEAVRHRLVSVTTALLRYRRLLHKADAHA